MCARRPRRAGVRRGAGRVRAAVPDTDAGPARSRAAGYSWGGPVVRRVRWRCLAGVVLAGAVVGGGVFWCAAGTAAAGSSVVSGFRARGPACGQVRGPVRERGAHLWGARRRCAGVLGRRVRRHARGPVPAGGRRGLRQPGHWVRGGCGRLGRVLGHRPPGPRTIRRLRAGVRSCRRVRGRVSSAVRLLRAAKRRFGAVLGRRLRRRLRGPRHA